MTKNKLIATIALTLGLSGATAFSDALWADTLFCTIPDQKSGLTCEELEQNPEVDVYYLVDAIHFDDSDIWETSHQNPETVRWNTDQTQFILKYDGPEIPRGEVGVQLGLHNPKTHADMMELLETTAWKIEDPFDPVVTKDTERDFAEDNIGR